MYIPDNYDAYKSYEEEQDRLIRREHKIQVDETGADTELPWVDVPNDYGTHKELYLKEDISLNIIKVKFLKDGQPSGRAYTYFSEKPVAVDDKVQINSQAVGVVTEIDVQEEEIAEYKDKVKFIHGKYVEPVVEKGEAYDGMGIDTGNK